MMKVIKTSKSPSAIGTYSQAIKVDNLIFTSGQIGLNPLTGVLVKGNIEEEIEQVLNNLENVLLAAGGSIKNIIKMNVYLIDLEDFECLNRVLVKKLDNENLPARATVQVSQLPQKAKVEIDAIGEII